MLQLNKAIKKSIAKICSGANANTLPAIAIVHNGCIKINKYALRLAFFFYNPDVTNDLSLSCFKTLHVVITR